MSRVKRSLVAVTLVALAAACVPKLQAPDVRLAGVRLGGLGLSGGMLYVRLNVTNPNSFRLESPGLSYDIDLSDPGGGDGWIDLAAGRFEEHLEVSARDSAVVEIPVEFSYSGVGGAIRSVLDRGTFNYRLSGVVTVDRPIRTDVPYRRRGTISLAGAR